MAPTNIYVPGVPSIGKNRRRIFLGSTSIPPVQPSIVVDFTANTATVNGTSTPVANLFSITRASTQSTIDASGNVGSVASGALAQSGAGLQIYAGATNKLLQSQAFASASWASLGNLTLADNVATAPDGTTTAASATANGVSATHAFQQASLTFATNTVYTVSIFVKQGTARYLQLLFGGGAAPDGYYATIDTQTGAVATSGASGIGQAEPNGLCRARSQALANGWYRFIVTFKTQSNATQTGLPFAIVPALNSGRNPTSTVNGSIFVWGAQWETGFVATPYIPTTTATVTRAADNISITGALATAIAASAGTLVITTGNAPDGLAGTIIDSNGTTLIGKTALNGCKTALGASLNSYTSTNWEFGTNTVAVGWDGSGGYVQLANGSSSTDAVPRTPSSTLFLGSTSGSSAFFNGNIKTISFYPSKQTFAASAATPLRGFDTMVQFGSNPILPFNTNANNTVAADAPYFRTSQLVGGTYYALAQGNNGSGATAWNNILVYSTTDFVSWTYVGLAWTHTAAAWDDHYLGHPAIIKVGSTWYAYYSGMNSAGTVENIGVATSTDFVNWTKYSSNPIITDNVAIPGVIQIGNTLYLYAADRPSGNTISYYTTSASTPLGPWVKGGTAIKALPSDWCAGTTRLNDPYVVLNPQGYYEMTFTVEYFTAPSPYTQQSIAYATSTDGINWTKLQAPILQGDGVGGSANNKYPGDALLFFNGSSVWLYYAGVNVSSVAQGCLAKIVP